MSSYTFSVVVNSSSIGCREKHHLKFEHIRCDFYFYLFLDFTAHLPYQRNEREWATIKSIYRIMIKLDGFSCFVVAQNCNHIKSKSNDYNKSGVSINTKGHTTTFNDAHTRLRLVISFLTLCHCLQLFCFPRICFFCFVVYSAIAWTHSLQPGMLWCAWRICMRLCVTHSTWFLSIWFENMISLELYSWFMNYWLSNRMFKMRFFFCKILHSLKYYKFHCTNNQPGFKLRLFYWSVFFFVGKSDPISW